MSRSNSSSPARAAMLVMATVCLAIAQPLAAQRTFTSLTVFGDSFSDTGNLYQLTGGGTPPSPPYVGGRFSNGLVWTDYFASRIGAPGDANPAFISRTNTGNYAIAGARTTTLPGAPPSTETQLGSWLTRPGGATVDPTGVYTYFAGANDLRDASTVADETLRRNMAIGAAQRVGSGVGALATAGAQFVLVPYAVNLGLVPESQMIPGRPEVLGELTALFNETLALELDALRTVFGGTSFFDLWLDNLFENVIADAQAGGARYGITDVVSPCMAPFAPPDASSCDVSLFSDALHPTTAGHRLVADAAYDLLAYDRNVALVPEPTTWALMAFGLSALAVRHRRSRAA